ncbi:YiiX/YebB-like N1pC/P60 family cysteine hydrolase [Alicyclobacillus dauci]|uniref:YiiX/YebB-like N1pC/P60 family cysteine hydrolase n=1 Tax=Alicyclobacillus dauci TaxID=1475485 RepID=UPI0038992474
MLLRPKVPVKLRQAVAQVAFYEVGMPYDPLSSLWDIHSAYCSKLVWQAYAKVGVQLCTARGWVLPDHIAASPQVVCIAHWGAPRRGLKPCGSYTSVP